MRHGGYRLRFRWHFHHPLLRQMVRISLPFFVSTSVGTLGIVVDRILASYLETGSIAALNYSFVLTQVPIGLIISSLATPVYTRLSQHHSREDTETFQALAMKGFRLVLMVIVPTTVWFLILRIPILHLVYQHGAFSSRSTALTQGTTLYFAVGLPGFAISFYLQRLFFSAQDTITPARYSVITILINIAADLLLVGPMQVNGLALATGAASWVNAALLTAKTLGRPNAAFQNALAAVALGGVLMGATAYGILKGFRLDAMHNVVILAVALIVTAGLTLVPYLLCLGALHFPEVDDARRWAKRVAGRVE